MFTYKGFTVIFNDLQNKYHVMEGYTVLGSYNTRGGAKCAITTKWGK